MLTRGSLLVVLFAWSLVALAEGYPGPKLSPAEAFDANVEVVGGAHRMFREGIDHPALKIGAWSIDGAQHEVTVKFQIEDIFGKPVPSRDELKILLPADGTQVERMILFERGLGYFSIHAQFEGGMTLTMG